MRVFPRALLQSCVLFLLALCTASFIDKVPTASATITSFASSEATIYLNTLQYSGIPISILGTSSTSVAGGITSTGTVLTTASSSSPNMIASAFTNDTQLQAQTAYSIAYTDHLGFADSASASRTITFMALGTGHLTVFDSYTLNASFGLSGSEPNHTLIRPSVYVQVLAGFAGFTPESRNFNTAGYTEYCICQPFPFSSSFGLHALYHVGDIGTLTITSYAAFTYSDFAPTPEPSAVLLLATGLAALGIWQWRQRLSYFRKAWQ